MRPPTHDEILLRILAEKRLNLDMPQPKEILEAARELDQVSFRQWTPKGVANVFRRYGLATKEIHGRKVYRTDLADLLRNPGDLWPFVGNRRITDHPCLSKYAHVRHVRPKGVFPTFSWRFAGVLAAASSPAGRTWAYIAQG